MSVRVELNEIPDQVARFGAAAFLVTVGDDGRAHPASVRVEAAGGTLRAGAGRRTRANVAERSLVTLLWAGPLDGFGLLVDGTAAVDGETIVVTPTSAILHKLQEA